MSLLRVGVGEDTPKQEGYINIDIRPLPNIDIVADAAHLPLKDNEHDGLGSRNLVEHFSRHEIDDLFTEWARVLKPGAELFIETVDMGGVMDKWRTIPTENWMDGMLGAQTYPENFHKMAFTEKIMVEKLQNAGFRVYDMKFFEHREIPRMQVFAQKIAI